MALFPPVNVSGRLEIVVSHKLLKQRCVAVFHKATHVELELKDKNKLFWDEITTLQAARGIAAIAMNAGNAVLPFAKEVEIEKHQGEHLAMRSLAVAHEVMAVAEMLLLPLLDKVPAFMAPVPYKDRCCEYAACVEDRKSADEVTAPDYLADIFAQLDTLRCINTCVFDTKFYLPLCSRGAIFLTRFVQCTANVPHEDGPEALARQLLRGE